MNLIFQTWAHIKKDLLIYEAPLAQIEGKENEKNITNHMFHVYQFYLGSRGREG